MDKYFLKKQNNASRKIAKRIGSAIDYRSILEQFDSDQLKQVAKHASEARRRKNCEKLFQALEKNDIKSAYREHETIVRHTRLLADDKFITNQQADEICFLIESALLDWLKKVDDCSIQFLDDIKTAIMRTESNNHYDSSWVFEEIEFYLQLGIVSQDSLNHAQTMVIKAGMAAQQANLKDIVTEFEILTEVLASWGAVALSSSMSN